MEIKAHDFICRCSDKERERADAVVAEVLQRLNETAHKTRPVTRENFISRIVIDLAWDHNQSLVLAADQWFGAFTDETKIQADRVEDAIAATWLYYANKPKQDENTLVTSGKA